MIEEEPRIEVIDEVHTKLQTILLDYMERGGVSSAVTNTPSVTSAKSSM
jgi:hypothetical protein